MNVLIVNGGKSATLARPFLKKYSEDHMLENSVRLRDSDDVEMVENEPDALDRLNENTYDSLIISTGGEVNGCYLLEQLRMATKRQSIPITII